MLSEQKLSALQEIGSDSYYSDYCLKVARNKDLAQELLQYICDELTRIADDRFLSIYNSGKLKQYFAGFAYKSVNGSHSDFHRKYVANTSVYTRDVADQESYNPALDQQAGNLKKIISEYKKESEYHWYNAELFNLTLRGYSFRKIQKLTGIYYSCVQKSVQRFKKEIQKRYEYTLSSQ